MSPAAEFDRPLRIALLSYRGKPHSGGQGVYVRHLSRELVSLGHRVEVIAGPPYPDVDEGVDLVRLPGLDLLSEAEPFRKPHWRELRTLPAWVEFQGTRQGEFPEPLAFSLRALGYLARRRHRFDIVHDNQCLGYGLLGLAPLGLPLAATVHHPIAIDRDAELSRATLTEQADKRRWYRFVDMQRRVAARAGRIITPSRAAQKAVGEHFAVPANRVDVVPLGVDHAVFRPDPAAPRVPGRIVTTASSDVPLKGLDVLLAAAARLRGQRDFELIVVGRPKAGAEKAISAYGLADVVSFRVNLPDTELAELVRSAEIACVPSRYEGFSLPAMEAMACGTPVLATDAGALPEVVADAGLLVPTEDAAALATALARLLDHPAERAELATRGLQRAARHTWRFCAEGTVTSYRRMGLGGSAC